MTENTTASGAADAELHALADRIEDAQGRAICISVESADYLREALAASAPVAPTLETEAVRWEFRWLNPANNPYSSPSEMAWKLVEPKGMQPLEAALSDLRAYRYAGNPCYEVRPLFAQAAPVAPAPQPVGQHHLGRNAKDDTALWHSDYDGKFWCGNVYHRTQDQLKAECLSVLADLQPAPLQQGEYLPLPEGWPARFRCDSCEGNGEVGEPMYQGYFQPPEKARCPECSGVGWSSEEQAYNADHIHTAIDADRAARGADSRIAELEAARIAYASEFPPDANGDPDIGNIHSNIRALKARGAAQAAPARKITSHTLAHDSMLGKAGQPVTVEWPELPAAPAPVAEDVEDAARWRLLPLFMQGYDVDWVELLYNLEAMFKRGVRAQAAQPEGGANANR